MKIIVAFKAVPDDQDVIVAADGSLDFSRAHQIVSTYDLNALEAAASLAAEDGSVTAVSVGTAAIDDSKLRKSVLARGIDELQLAISEELAGADARATALALADLISSLSEYDLILCGDGSADMYAQQVDVQLACALGLPVVGSAMSIEPGDGAVRVRRTTDTDIETIDVPLPAVIAVSPDIAEPRIPGMKDILAAGKKPAETREAHVSGAAALETIECRALEQTDRKLVVLDAADDGAIEQFAAALKAAL